MCWACSLHTKRLLVRSPTKGSYSQLVPNLASLPGQWTRLLTVVGKRKRVAWTFVILARLFEVAMALSLKASYGFTRPWPTLGFFVFAPTSFFLLALGLRSLDVGTAYAVWTGLGAVGTVIAGILIFDDPVTVGRMVAVVMVVTGIIGLRIFQG